MLYRRDRFFNVIVLVMSMLVLSYLCYQLEIYEIQEVHAKEKAETIVQNVKKYKQVTYYDVPLDQKLQDFINEQCAAAGVDVELALAVMKVESDFQFDTVSGTNDYGIMQINKINHESLKKKLNIKDFLDPQDCIKAGVYMLGNLDWCENEKQMLMCYNMGTAGARRKWKQGIFETDYTRKVLGAKDEIKSKRYEITILCDQDS